MQQTIFKLLIIFYNPRVLALLTFYYQLLYVERNMYARKIYSYYSPTTL